MIKDSFKVAAAITAGVVAILLIASMWIWGWGFFLDHGGANRIGQNQKELQAEGNGSYRIAAYDHYFDLCATVQTDKAQLRYTTAALGQHPDAQTAATLHADVLAQQNKLAGDVNQYNADAGKSYTIAQFKASDLPARLSIEGNTTCAR